MKENEMANADIQDFDEAKYRKVYGRDIIAPAEMENNVNLFRMHYFKEIEAIPQAPKFFDLANFECAEVLKCMTIDPKPYHVLIANKKTAHFNLAQYTIFMFKNMVALGKANKLNELLVPLKTSPSVIKKMNNGKLILFADTINKLAIQFQPQLAEFNITEKQIQEYQTLVSIFSMLMLECNLAAEKNSELQILKYRHFAKMMYYLEVLDAIMQSVVFSKRSLVEEYVKARKVIKMPKRTTSLKIQVIDAITGEFIYHAKYYVMAQFKPTNDDATKVKKTTAKGTGTEKNLTEGGWTLVVEEPDYEKSVTNFVAKTGRTVNLIIKLKKKPPMAE